VQYVEENIKAITVELASEELQQVREIAEAADAAQGDRYSTGMHELTYADTPQLLSKLRPL
jgi:hypothetical protein